MDKFGYSGCAQVTVQKESSVWGCAQMILHSPLGKNGGSESRSLPRGECPTGSVLGACVCEGGGLLHS